MSSTLAIGKDINGAVCDTLHVSSLIYAATLAADDATPLIVPENVNVAYFSYGSSGDVWVDIKNTATIPDATFIETTSELNPVSRFVVPGQTISFKCLVANPVQVSFYNNRNS